MYIYIIYIFIFLVYNYFFKYVIALGLLYGFEKFVIILHLVLD
jgi:hypothetical protein